jgi:hypothetical protein
MKSKELKQKDPVDHFLDALMANEAMNETKAYLDRGRRFESVEANALQTQWTTSFKLWFASREASDLELLNDAAAELRLRSLEIPSDTVRNELDLAHAEIKRVGPGGIDLKPKITAFLEELDRDPN